MPPEVPESIRQLVAATDDKEAERGWAVFLDHHSELLLRVARSLGGDHDVVMDRYAFILESFRRDSFQRLRRYVSDGRGWFTTWLLVVGRRLCLDFHRQRYGRPQGNSADSRDQHVERRRLTDLVGDELGFATLAVREEDAPDLELRRRDLEEALEASLAQLEPGERLLLRLRFEDGLSVPEIARLRGESSPFRLYRLIDRLLAGLRRSLREAGIGESAP